MLGANISARHVILKKTHLVPTGTEMSGTEMSAGKNTAAVGSAPLTVELDSLTPSDALVLLC